MGHLLNSVPFQYYIIMKIGVISDLHSNPPLDKDKEILAKCDVVCICGDVFDGYHFRQYHNKKIAEWTKQLVSEGKRVIATPGNHDIMLYRGWLEEKNLPIDYYCRNIAEVDPLTKKQIQETTGIEFLIDEELIIDRVKFFGFPESARFCNWAWMFDEPKLFDVYSKMPNDVDVLLCHTPPRIEGYSIDISTYDNTRHCGSAALTVAIQGHNPKWVFCGHIHSGDHASVKFGKSTIVNVSYVGENYKPQYEPFVFDIEKKEEENKHDSKN